MNVQNYRGDDWRCNLDRFQRQVERAKHFEKLGATDISVYYDKIEDYVVTEFQFKGNHYKIRVYKLWCVTINGKEDWMEQKRFYNEFNLFNFFEDLT